MAIRVNPYGGEVEDIELYGNEVLPPVPRQYLEPPHEQNAMYNDIGPNIIQNPQQGVAPPPYEPQLGEPTTVPISGSSLWSDILSEIRRAFSSPRLKAPLGRNIYGRVGQVKTPFPTGRADMQEDAAWVGRDGNYGKIELGNKIYYLDHNTWNMLIQQANNGELSYLGINSIQDLMRFVRNQGLFHYTEIDDDVPRGRG